MRWGVPPDEANVQALALLLESQDPLVVCEDAEEDRLISVIDTAASRLGLPVLAWRAHVGLTMADNVRPIDRTDDALECLAFIERTNRPSVYHLRGFDEPLTRGRIVDEDTVRDVVLATEGWSGAEIEQAVVAALHAAFSLDVEVGAAHLLAEIRRTTPLSVTMAERIGALRAWAEGRAVRADGPESA